MSKKKNHKKIKTVRIKCLKPTRVKRDACLLTMRRAHKCANYISQAIQENKIDTFNYKAKSSVDDLTYQDCKRYHIPMALVQSTRDKVIEATDSWLSNGKEGSPPRWNGIPAMRLDKRTLTVDRRLDKTIFWVTTVKGKVPLITRSPIEDKWLQNSHSYELIWSHRHQTFFIALQVNYGNTNLPEWKDVKHVLSFDINFGRIAVTVTDLTGKVLKVKFFHLGKLNQKHRHCLNLRKKLQQKGGCNSKIKQLKGKESNFSKDFCHKISAAIIELARGFENCFIVSESLKNIRKNKKSRKFNRRLHQMLIKLRNFVEYKARFNDMRSFLEIYPYGNSKSCSHCGSYDTLRKGRILICQRCGNRADADFNATVNCSKRALKYIFRAAGQAEYKPPKVNLAQTGRLDVATHSGVQSLSSGEEFVGNDNILLVKEQGL